MPNLELTAGAIEVTDTGGEGPALVFLHGLVMDGSVFDTVVRELRADFRCIVPTLPLGSHPRPMRPDAICRSADSGRWCMSSSSGSI